MPVSGPSSFVPVTSEFIHHWEAANAALGAGNEIVLRDGSAVGTLAGLRGELLAARESVIDTGVDFELAREELRMRVEAVQARLVEFNARVRADLPDMPLSRVLPLAFAVGDGEGAVRSALRQMSLIWARVNTINPAPAGMTLPLVLRGGFSLADLEAERAALDADYAALSAADLALRLARAVRNDLQEKIYAILKLYRQKVPTLFPEGQAMVNTLPALTPAEGHTPDAVAVVGLWDADAAMAKITWEASEDADLSHYEVRGVPGDKYLAADESVLARVPPEEARELLTGFALTKSGLTAGFKVYVVLKAGNERGSGAVYVMRP